MWLMSVLRSPTKDQGMEWSSDPEYLHNFDLWTKTFKVNLQEIQRIPQTNKIKPLHNPPPPKKKTMEINCCSQYWEACTFVHIVSSSGQCLAGLGYVQLQCCLWQVLNPGNLPHPPCRTILGIQLHRSPNDRKEWAHDCRKESWVKPCNKRGRRTGYAEAIQHWGRTPGHKHYCVFPALFITP